MICQEWRSGYTNTRFDCSFYGAEGCGRTGGMPRWQPLPRILHALRRPPTVGAFREPAERCGGCLLGVVRQEMAWSVRGLHAGSQHTCRWAHGRGPPRAAIGAASRARSCDTTDRAVVNRSEVNVDNSVPISRVPGIEAWRNRRKKCWTDGRPLWSDDPECGRKPSCWMEGMEFCE